MANNKSLKDGAGAAFTIKTTDTGGVNVPHHNIDTLPGTLVGLAIDSAADPAAVGIPALAVRKDTQASLGDTDGDFVGLQVNATGALRVDTGTPAGVFAEDASHTTADKGYQVLTVRKDTAAALAGTDGDYQPPITDASGRLHVNVGALPGSLTGVAEDAAHSSGAVGIPAIVVRQDTLAALAGSDGDNSLLSVDADGRLYTAAQASGAAASGAAAAGNPLLSGARAATSNPTAVDDGDAVALMADVGGKLIVRLGAPSALVSSGSPAAITDNAAHDVLAAAGASLKWYITSLFVSNAHATENTLVTIQDEDSAVVWRGFAKCLGGGFSHDFPVPLPTPTANKKLQAICATTGCSVYVNVVAYKAP